MAHTIVLTRPQLDSQALANLLRAQGFFCLIEPMLEIKISKEIPVFAEIPNEYQAIVITSRHALPVLSQYKAALSIPLIAVGKSSAEAAQALGFQNVSYADGNAESLATCILKNHNSKQGKILYAHGEYIHYDLASRLRAEGFKVEAAELYSAQAIHDFSAPLIKSLLTHTVDAVVFYSARTAQIYEKIAQMHEGLPEAHAHVIAVCLSQNIAETLHLLPWQKIYVDISNIARYISEKDTIQNI